MPYIILFILFIFPEFTYAGCENGDCHNGYGTYIWFNGDTDDRPWSHGDKFTGYFKNGKMHGQGSYFYTNGNVYVGNYFNGYKFLVFGFLNNLKLYQFLYQNKDL